MNINFPDFQGDISNWQLGANAIQAGNAIVLTPGIDGHGTATWGTSQSFGTFSSYFVVSALEKGQGAREGWSFAIHNAPLPVSTPGYVEGGGLDDLRPSLVVVFNAQLSEIYLMLDGYRWNKVGNVPSGMPLSGIVHCWVDLDESLRVYTSPTAVKPESPVLNRTVSQLIQDLGAASLLEYLGGQIYLSLGARTPWPQSINYALLSLKFDSPYEEYVNPGVCEPCPVPDPCLVCPEPEPYPEPEPCPLPHILQVPRTNLVKRLRASKNRLQPLLEGHGVESYQRYLHVVSTTILEGALTATRKYTLLYPNPKITNVPPRMVGMPLSDGTIVLSEDDFLVEHLNQAYPKELLTENVSCFVMSKARTAEGETPTGQRLRLIHIDNSKSLGWRLVLRKMNDRDAR